MRSLQGRLGAGLVLSLIVLFGAQWALVSLFMRQWSEETLAARLAHDAEGLLAALSFTTDGDIVLDPARDNPVYQRVFSGHYYRVATATTVLRSRSLWDQDLALPALAAGAVARSRVAGPQDQKLLVWAGGFRKQERTLTVAVAEDLAPVTAAIDRFTRSYALASLVILAVLIAMQQLIVRLSLRPLEGVRRDLARLQAGEIQKIEADVPTEVAPLVAEINRLLTALNQRLARSRNALGNLAHALKTPLTLLIQLAHTRRAPAVAQLRRAVAVQTDAIHRLVARELHRACVAGPNAPGRRFVCAQELPPLFETLRRLHRDRHLDIDYAAPADAVFGADREDMLELFGNLLDNACKWARARVRLTIARGAGWTITFEDDGPGCPPAACKRLATRGVRLDESTPGHGLGLAIARDVVALYAGRMSFARSRRLGGLQVRVRLPMRSG